jgi:hypothetical protein
MNAPRGLLSVDGVISRQQQRVQSSHRQLPSVQLMEEMLWVWPLRDPVQTLGHDSCVCDHSSSVIPCQPVHHYATVIRDVCHCATLPLIHCHSAAMAVDDNEDSRPIDRLRPANPTGSAGSTKKNTNLYASLCRDSVSVVQPWSLVMAPT